MVEGGGRFLGLTHNPFVGPQQGFFEAAGRMAQLEQLRQLSEWSRRVTLVTGPSGAGKTTLYRELSASLLPRMKAARIDAALINTGREVLAAIAQGFGLPVARAANTQMLRDALVAHVEEQERLERLCLVLIDDAHLLDNRSIHELLSLAQEAPLQLVLFGELQMVPVWERSAGSRGVGWQEIRLAGYTDAETRDYLEWRFQQAKYRGRVPFTDQQVRDLVLAAEGLPGRMDTLANELLVQLEGGGKPPGRHGFPRLHAALLVVVLIVTGLLYLLVLDEDGTPQQSDREPAWEPVVAAPPDTPEAESDAAVVAVVPEEAPQSRSEPAPEPPVEPRPEPDPPPQQETPGERPTVAGSPATGRDGQWLLAQDPAAWTLQIASLSSLERASEFVRRQREPDRFAILGLRREGRSLYVVVFGLFPTREEAEAAAAAPPAEIGTAQPWIRQLEQVQNEIRIATFQ